MQMATSVILHPNEILPTPLVLPHFLRLIVNVDDLSDHMLTVRLEVAALESPIRSMVKIIMFVVRKSAERRLLPVPVEATYVMRRLGSGQQGIQPNRPLMISAIFVSSKAFFVSNSRNPNSNGIKEARLNLKPRRKGISRCLIICLPEKKKVARQAFKRAAFASEVNSLLKNRNIRIHGGY